MTTLAHLRKTALSFPDTGEESLPSGNVVFTTGEVPFATARDGRVELRLPTGDVDRVLEQHPTAERATGAVRIPLADINGQQLNHWLRRAWVARAPGRLAEQAAAADVAVPGEVGDLPREIGRPATQALVGAGITTLSQVAARTEGELKKLHGMGPKAIRILREALHAAGRELEG